MDKSFTANLSFLSNFYPCIIEYEGIAYPSVEHAYQAAKTTDIEIRRKIASMDNVVAAKRIGKDLPLRDNWENLRIPIMEELLRLKFSYNWLRKKLVDTGDTPLVETNWWGDRFWGVCRGTGSNHLGRLLMKIREEYKNEA